MSDTGLSLTGLNQSMKNNWFHAFLKIGILWNYKPAVYEKKKSEKESVPLNVAKNYLNLVASQLPGSHLYIYTEMLCWWKKKSSESDTPSARKNKVRRNQKSFIKHYREQNWVKPSIQK